MNISKAFNILPVATRQQVSSEIVTGLIAYYLGADYRRYFKRLEHGSIGTKKNLYNFIAGLEPVTLERFAEVLTE